MKLAYQTIGFHDASLEDTVRIVGEAGFDAVHLAPWRLSHLHEAFTNGIHRVRDLTGGGADLVIDATGTHEGRRAALEAVGLGGRLHCVGIALGETPIEFLWSIMYPERTITGTWWSQYDQFDDIARLVTGGKVDLKPIITHHFPLDEINDAFATFIDNQRSHAIKVMVHP